MDKKYDYPEVFTNFPRNNFDFEGGIVLYSTDNEVFYHLQFGCGDNLDAEDIENGYDDYINTYAFHWNRSRPLSSVITDIKNNETIDDIEGLEEEDGGLMLVKRSEYDNSGDLRSYLENALEFSGYGVGEGKELYGDLIFVTMTD